MKKLVNQLLLPVLLLCMIPQISCRKEVEELTQETSPEVLNQNSELSKLLLRTALNDGSRDNILDNSSCFSVSLPVTVFLNGIRMSIVSEADFSLVEFMFDEFEDDEDSLEFNFPITLITADYKEIDITNKEALEEILENCKKNDLDDEDDDIECLDIKYPIAASIFDADDELISVITIRNDKKLTDFIEKLADYDRASLIFPITIQLADGSEVVVDDAEALENMIGNIASECDESEEGDLDVTDFTKIITSGSWEVLKFKEDQNNDSKVFDFYVFNFDQDGRITVTDGAEEVSGSWEISTRADGNLYVSIDFEDLDPFSKMNKKWTLKKVKDKMIQLENLVDNAVSKDELFFKKSKE